MAVFAPHLEHCFLSGVALQSNIQKQDFVFVNDSLCLKDGVVLFEARVEGARPACGAAAPLIACNKPRVVAYLHCVVLYLASTREGITSPVLFGAG